MEKLNTPKSTIKITVDRVNNLMQVYYNVQKNNEYTSAQVYMCRGYEYQNGVKLYDGNYSQNYFFPFTYSINNVADIVLVGVNSTGSKVLAREPLFLTLNSSDEIMHYEMLKVREQRRRTLLLAGEEVDMFLLQNSTKCTCWDYAYDLPDKSCSICGGSGDVNNYAGFVTRIKIPDTTAVMFDKTQTGDVTKKIKQGCWSSEFPYLSSKDIIRLKNGELYKVQKNQDESVLGSGEMVGQDFDLVSIQDYQEYNTLPEAKYLGYQRY